MLRQTINGFAICLDLYKDCHCTNLSRLEFSRHQH